TGQLPFRGATPIATALKHVQEPPPLEGPRAARIPETVVPILRKALAKNPDRRYPSAETLGQALSVARGITCAPPRIAPKAVPGPTPGPRAPQNPGAATPRSRPPTRAPAAARRHAIPALIVPLGKKEAPPPPDEDAAPLDSLLEPDLHRHFGGSGIHS